MLFDNADQRFDNPGFCDEKQERESAVATLVVLGHQVVDRFVEQTGVGERSADSPAFFRRSRTQGVVDVCGGAIRIEFVEIANGFFADFG